MEFKDIVNGVEKSIKIDPVNGVQRNNMPGDCLVPPGKISMFCTETPPEGWLECNGGTFDPNTYVDLSNAIGTIWSDNNTYKVPDLRGLFLKGWDGTGTMGTYEDDAVFNHNHTIEDYTHTHLNCKSNNGGSHEHGWHALNLRWTEGGGSDWGKVARGGSNSYWVWSDRTYTRTGSNHEHSITISDSLTATNSNTTNTGNENKPINYSVLHCIKY
tara:strand:+ start:283 stop:927 length:645 start_codon:yes stop_codon:yes gene_type:complete